MHDEGIDDPEMLVVALALIRTETNNFKPFIEQVTRYNTSPGGKPFDLYAHRADLGNHSYKDGSWYKARGYLGFTGRYNYTRYSEALNLGDLLLKKPEMAADPQIASRMVAIYLKEKEPQIRECLQSNNLSALFKMLTGSRNIEAFRNGYNLGRNAN